ncbi:hypothetical protein DLH72_03375 [Candidatus Gracilibacteria bacterium]|nr:MAG: hypothetical protein DLH72_03375 [Candidatus Gracilibacteria bacterium]
MSVEIKELAEIFGKEKKLELIFSNEKFLTQKMRFLKFLDLSKKENLEKGEEKFVKEEKNFLSHFLENFGILKAKT